MNRFLKAAHARAALVVAPSASMPTLLTLALSASAALGFRLVRMQAQSVGWGLQERHLRAGGDVGVHLQPRCPGRLLYPETPSLCLREREESGHSQPAAADGMRAQGTS